nr:hypothetical protein [Mycobacterium riyadhense]
MALGCENRQGRFDDAILLVGDQLPEGSIYRLLAEHGGALFGDDYFATCSRPRRGAARLCRRALCGHGDAVAGLRGLSDRKRVTGWLSTCVGRPLPG